MKAWLPLLHDRLRDEAVVIRVVVAKVRGSAPREPGACMLIGAQRIDGTIGGGHLELKATEIARQVLQQPATPTRLDRFALGATLGQCCGGAVSLWFERYDTEDIKFVAAALSVYRSGEAAVMVTLPHAGGGIKRTLHTARAPLRLVDDTTAAHLTDAIDSLLTAAPHRPRALLMRTEKREALLERIDPQGLPLWLFGAGHVGKALVDVLAGLPFQVTWIDSREEQFPHAPPAHVRVRQVKDPAHLVGHAPPAAYFLVMTHNHDLDYQICRAILGRNDFAWAGLIGSETKAACFNLRFGRDDIPAENVARLVSPIGIDGIDSKLPAAIAISVAAQLLQVAQTMQQSNATSAMPFLRGLQTS